jgi:signal transduction histidine kinase/CheY-like chemotaxis protein
MFAHCREFGLAALPRLSAHGLLVIEIRIRSAAPNRYRISDHALTINRYQAGGLMRPERIRRCRRAPVTIMALTVPDIADHIERSKDELLARWRRQVLDQITHARRLAAAGDNELFDHLPSLTDGLVAVLRGHDPDISAESRRHGHQRRIEGYSVIEVLVELTIYRRALFDLIDELGAAESASAEMAAARGLILDLLDVSVRASIDQFNSDAERERDDAAGAARKLEAQRERFLGTLSHELRNQISPILLAVELIKEAGPENQRIRRATEIIERQARHQSLLINELLDFNRVRFGKIELHRRMLDVRDSIRHAVETMEDELRRKPIRLELEVLREPIFANADPVRMAQIAINLLSNAIKFTPAGGKITWRASREGGSHVLTISDTGIGISPSDLARIFEMFYQADTAPTHRIGGLGIGLTIVRNLIELHGGAIEARSEGEGMGAEFTIRFPAAEERPEEIFAKPGCVLIVEDNPDQSSALSEVLAARGFDTAVAHDGIEALDMVGRLSPAAVIMDIAMPRMDGLELARRFRRRPGLGRELKLIALTGFGTPEDRDASREAGIDHHLIKPVNVSELVRLLRGE